MTGRTDSTVSRFQETCYLACYEDAMNIHARSGDAERAQSKGEAIYETLVPDLKRQGLKAGHFVAINIDSGEYVVAETRRELMLSYKEKFGRAVGWIRQIEY
jgi:hypothetical protein